MVLFIFSLLLSTEVGAVTIEEAFRSALNKNEVAGQAREQVFQAQEQINQAKAAVYPSLSLDATYLVQPLPDDPIALEFFPDKQATANLHLNQPLFKGFREFAAHRQRKNLLGAAEQSRLSVLLQLYEKVAMSCLDVLSLEQDLRNVQEQRKLYSTRILELQARARRGESSSSEALTAQASEAALEAETRMLQARLKSARENFYYVSGLPVDTVLTDEERSLAVHGLDQYLVRLEARPDIKSAGEKVSAAKEGVSIARGGHWPSLDLSGNYYLERPDGFLQDLRWDVQLDFKFPLFEGGLRQSQTQEAMSQLRESELALSQLRRQATMEVRSLHEGAQMRIDQLAALKRASELAEKNYQVLQQDYRRGLARNIDVQLAMTEYRISRRNFDQARFSAQLDKIRLETAAAILPPSLNEGAVK